MAKKVTRTEVREELVRSIHEGRKKSRLPINVRSIYERVKRSEKKDKSDDKKKKKDDKEKTRPDVNVVGRSTGNMNSFRPNGFYHGVELDFAIGNPDRYGNTPLPAYTDDERETWGQGFGNPLVNPKRDCVYIVRATVSQLRTDPMVGGFKLRWEWPPGWRLIDGQPRIVLVECSSNPLYVERLFLSPALRSQIRNNAVFRCRIRAWYP
jgi:hypothetical protein